MPSQWLLRLGYTDKCVYGYRVLSASLWKPGRAQRADLKPDSGNGRAVISHFNFFFVFGHLKKKENCGVSPLLPPHLSFSLLLIEVFLLYTSVFACYCWEHFMPPLSVIFPLPFPSSYQPQSSTPPPLKAQEDSEGSWVRLPRLESGIPCQLRDVGPGLSKP